MSYTWTITLTNYPVHPLLLFAIFLFAILLQFETQKNEHMNLKVVSLPDASSRQWKWQIPACLLMKFNTFCAKKEIPLKVDISSKQKFNADIFFFLKGIKFNASWAFNFNGRPKCRSDSETNVLLLVQAAIVPPSMLCAFLNTYLAMQIRNYLWYPLNVKSNLSTDKIESYFGC